MPDEVKPPPSDLWFVATKDGELIHDEESVFVAPYATATEAKSEADWREVHYPKFSPCRVVRYRIVEESE